jgi:hypothetical protein
MMACKERETGEASHLLPVSCQMMAGSPWDAANKKAIARCGSLALHLQSLKPG